MINQIPKPMEFFFEHYVLIITGVISFIVLYVYFEIVYTKKVFFPYTDIVAWPVVKKVATKKMVVFTRRIEEAIGDSFYEASYCMASTSDNKYYVFLKHGPKVIFFCHEACLPMEAVVEVTLDEYQHVVGHKETSLWLVSYEQIPDTRVVYPSKQKLECPYRLDIEQQHDNRSYVVQTSKVTDSKKQFSLFNLLFD